MVVSQPSFLGPCLSVLSTLPIVQMSCHRFQVSDSKEGPPKTRFQVRFEFWGIAFLPMQYHCLRTFRSSSQRNFVQRLLFLLQHSRISINQFVMHRVSSGLGNAGDYGRLFLILKEGFVILLSLDEGFLEEVCILAVAKTDGQCLCLWLTL